MKEETKKEFKKLGRLFLGLAVVLGAALGVLTLTGANETVRKWLAGLLIIIISIGGALYQAGSDSNSETVPESGPNLVEVVRVIDGDTIVVDRDTEVRLIGVDAPESGECFFQESRDALAELIEGKNVELKKDVSGMDDFGRLLRYVFLPSDSEYRDDLFVNKYLLDEGYADVLPLSQDRIYRRLLTSGRNEAITKRKGMWGACENQEEEAESFYPLEANDLPTDPKCTIKGNISAHGLSKTYFFLGCSNYDKVKIDFSKGEQYFCTEQEAIDAGFVKSGSCK